MGDVARIERVGGHPAVDFVNTLGGRPEAPNDEYLFGYADLVTFAEDGGLLSAATADRLRGVAEHRHLPASEVLERALQLRECLDRSLRAHLGDQPPSPRDLDVVRQAYITALDRAAIRRVGAHYDLVWPADADPDALDQPLWPLAAEAVELLRSAPLHRLARCGHCRWLFLDTSKNNSRRWCSMNACGSIMKMRRYRAAHHP